MTTYREAVTAFKVGDRVRLTEPVGDYPLRPVPKGSLGTVTENALGGTHGQTLYVKIDDHQPDLDEWDNVLHVYAPAMFGDDDEAGWSLTIPVELAT